MNTNLIAVELRMTHWAGIMKERSESGLSVKAYCERAGFHENIYYYWQRKLREAACEQMTAKRTDCEKTSLTQVGFTEIKISERDDRTQTKEGYQSEISFEAGGVRFTAGSDYPPEKIVVLLRGLVKI